MRNMLLALALILPSALPAAAQEAKLFGNKDLNMTLGYNMWLNQWTTWIDEAPANFVAVTKGGNVASNFTLGLRYKRVFTSLGMLITPDYKFPRYQDRTDAGVLVNRDVTASRKEVDWNLGFMFIPQLGATVGYKGITQKFKISTNNGAASESKTLINGVTAGLVASSALGNGFAVYGNGAGGIMSVKFENTAGTINRNDNAWFEATELGLAWRAEKLPLSAKLGYKFQKISTQLKVAGYDDQRGIDLTSGYILGMNLVF